ncbi:MAG: efflux RND transporter periplasmic adaptor subunit [Oceanipulchritudo sp.]
MNRSVWIALGIFVALSLYMLSGLIGCSREPEAEKTPAPEKNLMTVEIREMEAQVIPREVVLTGKTLPSRSVLLKSETSGRVVEVTQTRGRPVREGDLLARIELNDREEQLEQARAGAEQARLEHESVLRLRDQGLRSASQVARALSRLRGAEQLLRAIELDIRNTEIRVPFDGILQDRMVEVGDYIAIGDPVAEVLDLEPLVIEGEATEFQIELLEIGELGHARLSDGTEVEGRIRYVAGQSDARTRTFSVELEIANDDGHIPAGMTARLAVETERVPAYRMSPALISISDAGSFGVKVVDEENTVRFYEADIVKTEPDAIWLTGMPETIRLITVGQGFTQEGDRVKVAEESGQWQ